MELSKRTITGTATGSNNPRSGYSNAALLFSHSTPCTAGHNYRPSNVFTRYCKSVFMENVSGLRIHKVKPKRYF